MIKDRQELDELIDRYLKGNSTPEEQQYIDRWYSSLGSRKATIANGVERLTPETLRKIELRLSEKISRHVQRSANLHQADRFSIWYYSAVAASIVILIVAGVFLYSSGTFSTDKNVNERLTQVEIIKNVGAVSRIVELMDGSRVKISPQSELSVDFGSNNRERIVRLKGEAFFDVASDKSRPFYVYASSIVTKVLGTSFLVKAYETDSSTTVSVQEGKVSVYTSKEDDYTKAIVLLPNQEAVFNKSTQLFEAKLVENPIAVIAQRERELHFDETPIKEILQSIEEMYGVAIQYDEQAFAQCVLTTTFSDENLYDRLDIICAAIGSSYDEVDTKIVMTNPSCKKP
jgi:transmembrane sensor